MNFKASIYLSSLTMTDGLSVESQSRLSKLLVDDVLPGVINRSVSLLTRNCAG